MNYDVKVVEFGVKGGKLYGLWRLRGFGSEWVMEGVKDVGGGVNLMGLGVVDVCVWLE